jgi:adenylate cyclase
MRVNPSKWRIGRRELRMISGIVMLCYLASHLANHALGLVSLDAAEIVLSGAVQFWANPLVTVILYGAAAVHVALAIMSVYERRTFRLPPLELLRIALGLWLPVMLIGHAVTGRLEHELVRAPATYARVISGLWARDGEWQHMGLLAPGWLHGCLGLNFAFGRRPFWRRYRFVLFSVALLLPVLSALGFVEMGRELDRRHHVYATTTVPPEPSLAIATWRAGLLWGYLGLIGLAFAGRAARNVIENRQGNLVTITYPNQVVRIPRGWSVLEASHAFHIAHLSSCGGQARCSTCRVGILAGGEACPRPGPAEQATLERIKAEPDTRLACQLRPHHDISVVPLMRLDGPVLRQTVSATDVDRNVVILLHEFCNRRDLERDHLPHDVLFVFTRYAESACRAVHDAGGTVSYVGHDSICAIFGLHDSLARASRQALAAASHIGRALNDLNDGLDQRWGCHANIVVSIHAGFAALSYIGQGVETVIAAGPAMETAEALGVQARQASKAFAISTTVFDSAGYSHPPKDAQTFSLTEGVEAIQCCVLDSISDYVAGQPSGRLWRKTLVEASSLVRTIIET